MQVRSSSQVAVLTPVAGLEGTDPFGLRSELLDAIVTHRLTVLDLRQLATIEPPLVAAIRSALLRMQRKDNQILIANACPAVAAVLRTQFPHLLLLGPEEAAQDLAPDPA
jgi:hypothetical protein